MKAIWVILIAIVLAIGIVCVYLRGESTRRSLAEYSIWNQGPHQKWAVDITQNVDDLIQIVCDEHPDKCPVPDKKTVPPDPPPELP